MVSYWSAHSIFLGTSFYSYFHRFEVLIAGFLYIIDFEKNVQSRRCDPNRRRRIKRDSVTIQKKGIAGIRINSENEVSSSSSDDCIVSDDANSTCDTGDSSCVVNAIVQSLKTSSVVDKSDGS